MKTIGLLVTGHGEEEAVPVLVRRILHAQGVYNVRAGRRGDGTLVRKPEGSILKAGGDMLERTVERLRRRSDAILLVLDLEDGCPATIGPQLLQRVSTASGGRPCAVAIAYREFETWFLWDAQNVLAAEAPKNPERFRDAKGWIRSNGFPAYNERADSPGFAARLNIDVVYGSSDSFRVFVDRVRLLATVGGA